MVPQCHFSASFGQLSSFIVVAFIVANSAKLSKVLVWSALARSVPAGCRKAHTQQSWPEQTKL